MAREESEVVGETAGEEGERTELNDSFGIVSMNPAAITDPPGSRRIVSTIEPEIQYQKLGKIAPKTKVFKPMPYSAPRRNGFLPTWCTKTNTHTQLTGEGRLWARVE